MIRSTWIDPLCPEPAGSALQAEGLTAISRWLSGAIPPETLRVGFRIPEGCQHESSAGTRFSIGPIRHGLRSLRDRVVPGRTFRGCRSAQPPANCWQASGLRGSAQSTRSSRLGLRGFRLQVPRRGDGLFDSAVIAAQQDVFAGAEADLDIPARPHAIEEAAADDAHANADVQTRGARRGPGARRRLRNGRLQWAQKTLKGDRALRGAG